MVDARSAFGRLEPDRTQPATIASQLLVDLRDGGLSVADEERCWHWVHGAYSTAHAASFIRALCGRAIDNAALPRSVMPVGVRRCAECQAARARWTEATAPR